MSQPLYIDGESRSNYLGNLMLVFMFVLFLTCALKFQRPEVFSQPLTLDFHFNVFSPDFPAKQVAAIFGENKITFTKSVSKASDEPVLASSLYPTVTNIDGQVLGASTVVPSLPLHLRSGDNTPLQIRGP